MGSIENPIESFLALLRKMAAARSGTELILAFIESRSTEELRLLPRELWVDLLSRIPDQQDRQRILFAKNIKLYGGINEYINDFFDKDTVNRIIAMEAGPGRSAAVEGAKFTLERMATHEETSEENKARALAGKAQLDNLVGGRRRRRASRRRTTRKKRST